MTMKNIDDSMTRVMNRLPELADQMQSILGKIDGLLGAVNDRKLPEQVTVSWQLLA